jgi:L-aspartate oxidase
MWDFVGIVRSIKMLEFAQKRLNLLIEEISENWGGYYLDLDVMELKNIAVVAELIVRSALLRKESRGTHYLLDYPEKREDFLKLTILLLNGSSI